MGLFHKKEKAESAAEGNSRELIVEICETVDNANVQIELIKKEYEEVNDFLQDAGIIAGLPEEVKAELMESAEHLISLRRDMSELSKKRTELTEFQFGIMERYEDIIPSEIERLKKEEEYRTLIKDDLRKLAGEKGVLRHEADSEAYRAKFLIKLGIISGIVIGLLLIMYLLLYMVFDTFADIPFLLTIAGGIFVTGYIFFETDRNKKAIKLNVAKMNRLTLLTNKVKVKYINQTASLDYSNDKYAINNVRELEYRFEKYKAFKADEAKRKKTSGSYDFLNAKFKQTLEDYHIHDPEVWSYQAGAIIDKKEMVEIRHKLNERRKKLRDGLDYNMKIVEGGIEKLKKFMEKNPNESRMISELLEVYGIKGE